MDKQTLFYDSLYPYVVKVMKEEGINPAWAPITTSQAMLETTWGASPATGINNFFGMKATKNQEGKYFSTREGYGNNEVRIRDKFLSFPSVEEGVRQGVRRLKNKFHAYEGTPSAEQYVKNINSNPKAPYFTGDPSKYIRNVHSIANGSRAAYAHNRHLAEEMKREKATWEDYANNYLSQRPDNTYIPSQAATRVENTMPVMVNIPDGNYVQVRQERIDTAPERARNAFEAVKSYNRLASLFDFSNASQPSFEVRINGNGGSLKGTTWDSIPMKQKSEVINLAVQNGIYDLDTIRNAYNEFAGGGRVSIAAPGLIPNWSEINNRVNNLFQYSKSYLKNKFLGTGDGEVIDLSDKKVSRINSNTNNVTSILTNDFVEHNNNMVRKKRDFINTTDTLLGDKKIPLSKISTFYGIENGKLKAGPLEIFDDRTTVVPNRAKNIGKIKEYYPGRPESKEYKDAVEQGIVEYNNSKGYEANWLDKLLPLSGRSTPSGILFYNLLKEEGNTKEGHIKARTRRADIINNIRDKYSYLDAGALPFVVTENNDTIKGYELNACPKTLFADESGNAFFVANPRGHVEEINAHLTKHPMYPIMVDNGRYSGYQTDFPNAEIYGGLNRPDDMFILGTTKRLGGSIHIDPSKKGTFTAAASRHGKSVQEFASQVLAHPDNYSPAMRKKANFARNAKHWKH